MLSTSAYRYSNIVRGATASVYSTLFAAESVVDDIIVGGGDVARLENVLTATMDSNPWIAYLYVHIIDKSLLQSVKPVYLTESGKFLMLFSDTNLAQKGGVEIMQAEDRIINQRSVAAAISKQEEGVGRPQNFSINNQEILAYNVVIPMTKNGKLIGVIGALGSLEALRGELTDPGRSVFEGDQRLLLGENGLIAVSPALEFIGKGMKEVNSDPSADVLLDMQKTHKDGLFDFTPASTGVENRAFVVNFPLWENSDNYWSIVTMAPKSSINTPVVALVTSIIIVSLIVVVAIVLIVSLFVKSSISSRIQKLQVNLVEFFRFINHETKNVSLSKDTSSNDELGIMAQAINANIEKTKLGLEQDLKAVTQSVQTAKAIEEGDL
ncbi:hypothetical protein, partial [Helicobacter burdigaliensis]|uniref:hypothetical protein n=1 Tax=Helicobacter burdigaliensis TaxID=2315334 RepID=UPI0039E7A59D